VEETQLATFACYNSGLFATIKVKVNLFSFSSLINYSYANAATAASSQTLCAILPNSFTSIVATVKSSFII
jgi:hypothetical protein